VTIKTPQLLPLSLFEATTSYYRLTSPLMESNHPRMIAWALESNQTHLTYAERNATVTVPLPATGSNYRIVDSGNGPPNDSACQGSVQ
jgi:hypothetical protein